MLFLNRTNQQFPPDFLRAGHPPNVVKVIRQLIDPDPTKRPSAGELLQSSDIPAKIEVEEVFLKEALTTLSNPQSSSFARLIRALFNHDNPEPLEITYDPATGKFPVKEVYARELVAEQLRTIFHLHGAVSLSPPLFTPKPLRLNPYRMEGVSGASHTHRQPTVDMLDSEGNVVCLPSDLITPFARFVARADFANIKRYTIAKIFKKSEGGGHPVEETWGSFDIVHEARQIIPEILETEVSYLRARSRGKQLTW